MPMNASRKGCSIYFSSGDNYSEGLLIKNLNIYIIIIIIDQKNINCDQN